MAFREPINFREWRLRGRRLFTCGRPGRAVFLRERRAIDERTIDLWVSGLPPIEPLHIVSLLGWKKGRKGKKGLSEFDYYPFRSSEELGTKPAFQDWLNERYGTQFVVHEFRTTDAMGIDPDVLERVIRYVANLLEGNNSVVIVDSAGAERTARVCEKMGYEPVELA
jgi:hypothetical protein